MVNREPLLMEGQWVLDPKPCTHGALPQKLATAFYDLFAHKIGASFTPLVYCGHQLVNGTNYMLICKVVYATATPKTSIVQVILHETIPCGSIFGEFSVLSIEDIVQEAKVGGYRLQPFPYMPGDLLHDPIHDAFEQALANFDGSAIVPLAFCGTQFVSPELINHMFICKSTVVGSDQVSYIDVVVLGEKDKAFTLSRIIQVV